MYKECDFARKSPPKDSNKITKENSRDPKRKESPQGSNLNTSHASNFSTKWEQTDFKKLRYIIRLCVQDQLPDNNEEPMMTRSALKTTDGFEGTSVSRNNATFKTEGSKTHDLRKDHTKLYKDDFIEDSVGLAFRSKYKSGNNKDQIMYKKMMMQSYVEELRSEANKEIYNFFKGVDPHTAPRNLKLLYFYFVGSRNLNQDMQTESVAKFKASQSGAISSDLRKNMTGKTKRVYRRPNE